MKKRLLLLGYPLLEAGCLWGAWTTTSRTVMVLALAAASLALCFAVHISFHEWVHQQPAGRYPTLQPVARSIATVCMGIPFDGYWWHHMNHHRFENTLDDYSSTWRVTAAGPKPRSLASYVAGWPVQFAQAVRRMKAEDRAGHFPVAVNRWLGFEKGLLALVWMFLLYRSWRGAVAYAALIYMGWAWVALLNYFQHPPIRYGQDPVTSFYSVWYNRLFLKNGLHAEHHARPQIPWLYLILAIGLVGMPRSGEAHADYLGFAADQFLDAHGQYVDAKQRAHDLEMLATSCEKEQEIFTTIHLGIYAANVPNDYAPVLEQEVKRAALLHGKISDAQWRNLVHLWVNVLRADARLIRAIPLKAYPGLMAGLGYTLVDATRILWVPVLAITCNGTADHPGFRAARMIVDTVPSVVSDVGFTIPGSFQKTRYFLFDRVESRMRALSVAINAFQDAIDKAEKR